MTKRKPPAVPRQGYHQDRTKRAWLPFAARGFSKPTKATRDELRSIIERERILKDAPKIASAAIARGWARLGAA